MPDTTPQAAMPAPPDRFPPHATDAGIDAVGAVADRQHKGMTPRPLAVRINEWLLGAILAVMATLQFVNVIVRYFTDDSVAWAEEVSRHLMIWLVFLGLGSAFRIGLHMAIDNLHHAVPAAAARAIRLGIVILLVTASAVLVYQGWAYMALAGQQTTPLTQIPFSYVYAALPAGFALMLAHILAIAPRYVRDGTFDVSEDVSATDASAL